MYATSRARIDRRLIAIVSLGSLVLAALILITTSPALAHTNHKKKPAEATQVVPPTPLPGAPLARNRGWGGWSSARDLGMAPTRRGPRPRNDHRACCHHRCDRRPGLVRRRAGPRDRPYELVACHHEPTRRLQSARQESDLRIRKAFDKLAC